MNLFYFRNNRLDFSSCCQTFYLASELLISCCPAATCLSLDWPVQLAEVLQLTDHVVKLLSFSAQTWAGAATDWRPRRQPHIVYHVTATAHVSSVTQPCLQVADTETQRHRQMSKTAVPGRKPANKTQRLYSTFTASLQRQPAMSPTGICLFLVFVLNYYLHSFPTDGFGLFSK